MQQLAGHHGKPVISASLQSQPAGIPEQTAVSRVLIEPEPHFVGFTGPCLVFPRLRRIAAPESEQDFAVRQEQRCCATGMTDINILGV